MRSGERAEELEADARTGSGHISEVCLGKIHEKAETEIVFPGRAGGGNQKSDTHTGDETPSTHEDPPV